MTLDANDVENLLAAITPGGIEAQEAQGQTRFVAADVLPKECPQEQLQALGFKFGKIQDELFIETEFPEGWKKVATDHSMWSDLLDEQDRVRGHIFYKAAFYDRSSHMHLCTFIKQSQVYESHKDYIADQLQYYVSDANGEYLFKTEAIKVKHHTDEYWEAQERGRNEVMNWLNDHFPEWEDVEAYWD